MKTTKRKTAGQHPAVLQRWNCIVIEYLDYSMAFGHMSSTPKAGNGGWSC